LFQMFQRYVACVLDDIAKVDQRVAYVVIVVHVCRKRPQCFICISELCCKYVYLDVAYDTHILQVFCLNVV
jgi:hypothetical protein